MSPSVLRLLSSATDPGPPAPPALGAPALDSAPLGATTPVPADVTALSPAAMTALRAAEDAARRVRTLHVRIHRHAVSPLDTHGGTLFAEKPLGTFECSHCQQPWPCPTVDALTQL